MTFREGRSEYNRDGKPAGLVGLFLARMLKKQNSRSAKSREGPGRTPKANRVFFAQLRGPWRISSLLRQIVVLTNVNEPLSYLRYPLNFLAVAIRAIGDDCQGAVWPGSSPFLGRVGSSRECAAAVAEVVFRRWGRHRAGTRPAPTGPLGEGSRRRRAKGGEGRHRA